MTNSIPIITIDGDSGSGKGTLAHALADHFKLNYLDSGAIYRMVAYAAIKNNWLALDEEEMNAKVQQLDLHFNCPSDSSHYLAYCDDEEVTSLIRDPEISSMASQLSARQSLRDILLDTQRNFVQAPGLVTDGRDMGSVIFPKAHVKFYLTADPSVRAKRRYKQLKDGDNDVSLADIEKKLLHRDTRDKTRKAAPLVAPVDAHIIDSSLLTAEQVFDKACQHISDKGLFSK